MILNIEKHRRLENSMADFVILLILGAILYADSCAGLAGHRMAEAVQGVPAAPSAAVIVPVPVVPIRKRKRRAENKMELKK